MKLFRGHEDKCNCGEIYEESAPFPSVKDVLEPVNVTIPPLPENRVKELKDKFPSFFNR